MEELKAVIDKRLKNINLLFDIAESLCKSGAMSVDEIKSLVMSEIVKLSNLYRETEESRE